MSVGDVVDHDIVAIFGDVNIEGKVTGQVVVIMGKLVISGTPNARASGSTLRPSVAKWAWRRSG